MNNLTHINKLGLLIFLFIISGNALSYKIIPGESVHESITAMAFKCVQSLNGGKPNDCNSYRAIGDVKFKITDYVSGLEPLYRAVSWPDDPTREFTEFSGALSAGAKVHVKNEVGCTRDIDYVYRLDKDGLFCSSHFGQLQFLHAQAASTSEKASETYEKIFDWALFLYGVAIDQIDTEDDYCKFWKKRNSVLSKILAPTGFAYCDKRFSLKKLFSFKYPYYPEWKVGTLLNFTCRNPISSKTCSERISSNGKIWAQQNATGALLHLIQDSYSQSHTKRGVCENDVSTSLPISKIECLPIKRYYTYGIQNRSLHGKADLWPTYAESCNSDTGIDDPILASALILWHIEHKTFDISLVKSDLYKVFGKPEHSGNDAAVAGDCFGK